MSVYMVLLVLVPSPPYIAIRRRELLPRGFTLTLSGGLFSVTAFIRLLPSVLSTAGRPTQSGLSSETSFSDRSVPPVCLRTICIRASARSFHFACPSSRLPCEGLVLCLRSVYGTALISSTFCRCRSCCVYSRCSASRLPASC